MGRELYNKMKKIIQISISDKAGDIDIPHNPPEGITLSGQRKKMSLDGAGMMTIIFVIELAASIPAGILAAWLYDEYCKAKPALEKKTITINQKTITFIRQGDLELLIKEVIQTTTEE
jgi:hypothetical protein